MINVKDSNVLLIGGAGFIGHHLAINLQKLGAQVTVYDQMSVNNIVNLSVERRKMIEVQPYSSFIQERLLLLKEAGVEILIGDGRDRYQLSQVISKKNYKVVYLLAAVYHASRANSDPLYAIDNSLVPFTNAITLLSDKPDVRLVFLSSSTVYGNFSKPEVDEDDPCNPFGMYAVLKHTAERLLQEVSRYSELNYSVVRPSALYGERCISRRVSQIFLENAFNDRDLIFRGLPDETLDFTYIQDVCQGLILSGFHENAYRQLFNITYGQAQPVIKLAEILKEYCPNLVLKIEPRDQATPKRGTLSNKKASELLGFKSEWHVEDGYRKYIEWYLSREKDLIFSNLSQANE